MRPRIVAGVIALSILPFVVGCAGMDGRTDSVITGEYSNESEIKAAARQQEAELIGTINGAESMLESLYANVESELAIIGAENLKRNSIIERGLGITSGLIDMFVPQAKPVTDGLFPLVSDLFLLGGLGTGIGVAANRRGKKQGASTLAEGVQLAADQDEAFRESIKTGKAGDVLKRHFQKAPAPVKRAINENEVT